MSTVPVEEGKKGKGRPAYKGNPTATPTTLELVQRRVTRSETSFEFDKLNNPGMRYAYTCGAFFANQQDPRADATDADGYDDEPWGSDSDLDADTSDVHGHGAA